MTTTPVEPDWLDDDERAAWVRLAAVVELLPGVLDSQLRADADLSYFEYFTLAMLSEEPGHALRMKALAARTNATLPRLSHVVTRLEQRGLVERVPCAQDARVTEAHLTDAGWRTIEAAAPGHVAHVRETVMDALDRDQVHQLAEIGAAVLARIDPEGLLTTNLQADDGSGPGADHSP